MFLRPAPQVNVVARPRHGVERLMNQQDLEGKTLTLLLMGKTQGGEEDWAVFGGTVRLEAGLPYLDRGLENPRVEIREEWLERIKPVSPDLAETLLGAAFYLPLSVGNLDGEGNEAGLVPFGLKWPDPAP